MARKNVSFNIGEKELTVPVMNLGQLEEYLDLQNDISKAATLKDQMYALVNQIMVAIKPTYPDMTKEQVMEALVLEELWNLTGKISEAAGLVKPEVGEAQATVA